MPLDERTLAARRDEAKARRRVARRRLLLAALVVFLAAALFALVRRSGDHRGVATRPAPAGGAHGSRGPRPPGQDQAITHFLALARPVYCGGRRVRAVALTFDDGPGPYTRLALRELAGAHAHATFFLVGRNLPGGERAWPGARSLVIDEQAHGAIANHTFTHPFLPALSSAALSDEVAHTQRSIAAVTGHPPKLFRPPYGGRTPQIDQEAARQGMLEVLWNIDSQDSLQGDAAAIAARVERGLGPGSIILMHENHGQTILALRRRILPALARRHLKALSVPELLATDPPTDEQVKAGPRGCPTTSPTTRLSG